MSFLFDIYKKIIDEGHAVANHTNNHFNGWKTDDEQYLLDIKKAMNAIDSKLFRPPYGRITRFQLSQLLKPAYRLYPIMWSVLSGDFDKEITPEKNQLVTDAFTSPYLFVLVPKNKTILVN